MKLLNLTTLLTILISVILCSCNTSDNLSDPNAISDQEKAEMVNFARYSLNQTKKIITDEEKALIMQKAPDIKEYYTGYKTGRMSMSWELPNKRVNIVATGRLLSDTMGWELAVTKKEETWTTTNASTAKSEKANPKDFLHLINKP